MVERAQPNHNLWGTAELDLILLGSLGASVAPETLPASNPEGSAGDGVALVADVRFPAQVGRNTAQSLSVQLRREAGLDLRTQDVVSVVFDADPGQLPPPEIVEVRLNAPDFREQTGVWERTMMVYPTRDSQPAVFLVQTDRLGRKRLTLDFYHKGRMLGTIHFESEVVQEAPSGGPTVTLSGSLRIGDFAANPPPPADLELRVMRTAESNGLSFVLHTELPDLPLRSLPVGQVTLTSSDPQAFFSDRLQRLTDLARAAPAGSDAVADQRLMRELEQLGEGLFEMLLPLELQRIYWEQIAPMAAQGVIRTLLINSEDPWIPWELIKPYRWSDEDNTETTTPFLVEQFTISRWSSRPPSLDVDVKQAALVMPDLDPPHAQKERSALGQLAQAYNLQLQGPLQQREQVLDTLRTGDFQLLHFSVHGAFNAVDAEQSELRVGDAVLTPADLIGGDLRGLRRQRPLVFLNACAGGRNDFALTGIGGWAHKFFVEGRASAFVGTLWAVNPELAAAFAEQFYTLLAQGYTLGEAARAARFHIREMAPSDPSWLAYVVYGDPNLLVRFDGELQASAAGDKAETEVVETEPIEAETAEAAEAGAVQAVDWCVAWEGAPDGELAINKPYTLTLRFSRTGEPNLRVPASSQALTIFVDASPGLHLETPARLYAPAQAGDLVQTFFEVRFRPVLAGAMALEVRVHAGREVEGAEPAALPLPLRVAPAAILPDIREILDQRQVPPPLPDVLLYTALEAVPVTAQTPEGVQLRLYLSGPLAGTDENEIVRLPPLALTSGDVMAINAAAAAAAQETQADAGGDLRPVRRLGMALYDLLMPPGEDTAANRPPDLRTIYWRLAWLARRTGRTPTWLVISDPQAVLPWELVRPYSDTGKEEDFLAAQFTLCHWIGRSQLQLEAMAPVRKLELVHYGQAAADLPAWQAYLGGAQWVDLPAGGDGNDGAGGDLRLTQMESEIMGLHVLRYVENDGPGAIVSAREGGTARAGEDVVATAARQRLDFAARHPIIGLSWVDARLDDRDWLPAAVSAAPVDEWALPLLRAEASAVVGPRWPTAVESDRRFYALFYAALRGGVRLGAAVRMARLAVRAASPQSADWLAYTCYGHPDCEPYQVVRAEAFALLEVLGHPDDQPLAPGEEYTLRAAYRALAPENYQGRVYLEQPLPELADPKVLVDANFLPDPLDVPMRRANDLAYEAIFKLRMPANGRVARIAAWFQDGGERLQVLDLYLEIAADAPLAAPAPAPAGGGV